MASADCQHGGARNVRLGNGRQPFLTLREPGLVIPRAGKRNLAQSPGWKTFFGSRSRRLSLGEKRHHPYPYHSFELCAECTQNFGARGSMLCDASKATLHRQDRQAEDFLERTGARRSLFDPRANQRQWRVALINHREPSRPSSGRPEVRILRVPLGSCRCACSCRTFALPCA